MSELLHYSVRWSELVSEQVLDYSVWCGVVWCGMQCLPETVECSLTDVS